MDDDRRDTLTDDAIDRQLRAVLEVEPSHGLAARVRTRVARESMARVWSPAWRWIGSAAAAAGVAVALVLAQSSMPVPDPRPELRPRLTIAVPPAAPDGVAQVAPVVAPRPVLGRRARPPLVPPDSPVPQALFSSEERQALEWLIAVASGRRVDAPPSPQPVEPMDVREVAIVPLAIEPLPQLASLE